MPKMFSAEGGSPPGRVIFARSSASYGHRIGPKMAMRTIVPTMTLPTRAMR